MSSGSNWPPADLLDDYDDFDSKIRENQKSVNEKKSEKSSRDSYCSPISLSTFCCLPGSKSDQLSHQVIEMQSSKQNQTKQSNSKTRDSKKNKKAARYRDPIYYFIIYTRKLRSCKFR